MRGFSTKSYCCGNVPSSSLWLPLVSVLCSAVHGEGISDDGSSSPLLVCVFVCVCVCVCVCEGTSMCRLCPAPCGSPCLCFEVRLPRYTCPADITSHYREEFACVSTLEVARRNYPSRPVLQQTATGAVIGSNNTQPIILGLKTTLYVVLIGVE